MRTDILEKKEEINKWINDKKPKSFICRELKCKPITLDSYLNKMNIIYKGNQGLKGMKIPVNKKKAIEYLFNGSMVSNNLLKKKLFEENIKENKCEKCDLIEWNNKTISMELHHINGDRFDNKLENLKILCPNCHSQTENFSGKNMKIKIRKNKKQNFCKCGKEIQIRSKMCIDCYNSQQRKIERPTHERLLKDIENTNYKQTGKKYGVSDNTIRKWLKNYNG